MSLVKDKYGALAPRIEYLEDVVVLAQAWKKSHTYIRRHNWYADTLELDCSAVLLDQRLDEWAKAISDGTYEPEPARVVPAPKNAPWEFSANHSGGWGPRANNDRAVLRPLAHLGIREQTVATAVMLCLADCIETAQGNPAMSPEDAAANGVHSYGNRLYCSWSSDETQARFSWGNSNTYSRYFQDYQRFVERPNAIARRIESQKTGDDVVVYIVKLDLSAFYDNVDIDRLVHRLKTEHANFVKADTSRPAADETFWTQARQALAFRWRDEDKSLAPLFRDAMLPDGLPQGLVASGFFANAYLLDFDRAVGAALRNVRLDVDRVSIRVHDYCRYVDDLRFVISIQGELADEVKVGLAISEWVQAHLSATTEPRSNDGTPRLRINERKTELELFSAVGGESGTAAQMKSLQQQLSGPFDVATLQQVETGLSGLLSLAELRLMEGITAAGADALPVLASVARTKLEVRDDTLTRFSAYRLTRSLRLRRSMTDLTEMREVGSAKDALLQDFEAAARRLIAAWAVNPSLVQVLRFALDVFPSPELLSPVAEALTRKLTADGVTELEQRVVFYVLAELFKAGATETGKRSQRDADFSVGDVFEYRAAVADLAQTVLEWPGVPWYVQQQAAILLAALGQSTDSIGGGHELRFHRALHEFIAGKCKERSIESTDEIAISLVGNQLIGDPSRYDTWFKRFAYGRPRTVVAKALQVIGQTNQELFADITWPGRGKVAAGAQLLPRYLGEYLDARWPRDPPPLPTREWISFTKVITHPSAAFAQENALLRLALLLAELPYPAFVTPERLTPSSLRLRCEDWAALNDPRANGLEVKFVGGSKAHDPLYATPSWCRGEQAWMYAIGRLLRSAATGELDFTARHWLLREDVGWYAGIRSSWHKRRVGMLHTSAALAGSTSAITPWFSNLLIALLRWPGIAIDGGVLDLNRVEAPSQFAALVRARIVDQAELFGASSRLPVYRYPVEWPVKDGRHLRVVLVQGLMPMQKDFVGGFDGLEEPGYRERHRSHTAALLNLAYRHLAARDSVLGKVQKPQVDLVVFPEYAVHVDDQDLMRAFSDATGAMLFYGLLGATAPGSSQRINAARWLVPQRRAGRRSWIEVDQGKWHLTDEEKALNVSPWRPYQVVIELQWRPEPGFKISGAICYDATDISLAADLKDESHMFAVAAMNKDVKTFDSMVAALRYHMYQHVLIANCGEFGGSTAQAPYEQEYRRLVSHSHGSQQIAISVFDICVDDFGPALNAAKAGVSLVKAVTERIGKTPPAGLSR